MNDRHTDQWNITGSPEIKLYVGSTNFFKGCQENECGKEQYFQQAMLASDYIHMKG